jgi:hypothetical protein
MFMEPIPSPEYEIRDITCTIRNSEIHLTWYWPKAVNFVYLYKAESGKLCQAAELTMADLRLYTREEYKANQGYIGKLDTIGKASYQIFPCQKDNGKLRIFSQENDKNLITISGHKAKVYFSIAYKNKFMQKRKTVKMAIMTELPLDKELLCYVRKRDSVPISLEDGTWFPYIRDFPAGETYLPEIEIDKNEYIRIFLNEGKNLAEKYELIPL